MAEIKIDLKINTAQSITTLGELETSLSQMKNEIKGLDVSSEEFKKMSAEIKATESQVKNLNKSFEGLDTEALVGEYGKMAAGIMATMNGINAIAQNMGNEDVVKAIQNVQMGMAVVDGIKGATEAWTAAQKVLNLTMLANPVVALAAALVALAAAVYFFATSNKAAEQESERLNAQLEKQKQLVTDLEDTQNYQLRYASAIGKSAKELLMLEMTQKKTLMNELEMLELSSKRAANAAKAAGDDDKVKQLEDEAAALIKKQEKLGQELNILAVRYHNADLKEQEDANRKKAEQDQKANDLYIKRLQDRQALERKLKEEQDAALLKDLDKYLEQNDIAKETNAKTEDEKLQEQMAKEADDLANKLAMEAKAALKKDEEDKEKALSDIEFQQELRDIDMENRELTADEIYESEKKALDDKQALEIKNTDGYKKIQKQKESLDRWYSETKRQKLVDDAAATADALGQAAELFGKDTAAYKILASAEAIINTWLGVSQTLADKKLPTIAKIITVPTMIATGLMTVAKINAVTFGQGGVLEGPSHAEGGILTDYGVLEGGEGIINKNSMSNTSLRNMVSAANVAGGGTSFSTGDGSIHLSQDSISSIVNGINNKKVYVTETDITETQNKVKVIEDRATY